MVDNVIFLLNYDCLLYVLSLLYLEKKTSVHLWINIMNVDFLFTDFKKSESYSCIMPFVKTKSIFLVQFDVVKFDETHERFL